MRDHSFASIVTAPGGELFASHAPVIYRPEPGPHGSLLFHLARANEQCRHLSAGESALVIFNGPHSYMSPSWYLGEDNVPTWNYVVVQARGRARELTPEELRAALSALVTANEAHYPAPWSDLSLSEGLVSEMLKAIVGFELVLTGLDGKLKLSQNREPEDRLAAQAALAKQDDANAQQVAAWMARIGGVSVT